MDFLRNLQPGNWMIAVGDLITDAFIFERRGAGSFLDRHAGKFWMAPALIV